MKIPDKCYALNNMTTHHHTKVGQVIEIRAFEEGFYRTKLEMTQEEVNLKNEKLGVDIPTSKAMYDASMFGWACYKNCLESHQALEAKKLLKDPEVRKEFGKLMDKIKKMTDSD